MRAHLAAAIFLFTLDAHAATLSGRVVGISDGDTVTLLDRTNTQVKIRLSGIDAPERAQPFGAASKKSLSDMVYNKTVSIDYDKQDPYGLIVGKILLNGRDLSACQPTDSLGTSPALYVSTHK